MQVYPMKPLMQPPKLTPWLTEEGSITDKLKALTNQTHLEVLTHHFEQTDTWDINTLNLPKNTTTLHREILMWADTTRCWYARTILPEFVYHTETALFNHLQTTALGELIHHHPEIKRTKINPYAIHAHMPEYHYLKRALKQNIATETLWGRVSTFTIRNQFDFYLLEILLPGLLKYCP
jgi:chorismate lyase